VIERIKSPAESFVQNLNLMVTLRNKMQKNGQAHRVAPYWCTLLCEASHNTKYTHYFVDTTMLQTEFGVTFKKHKWKNGSTQLQL
jgi:hypothetical protein